jgi:hypothetical protein
LNEAVSSCFSSLIGSSDDDDFERRKGRKKEEAKWSRGGGGGTRPTDEQQRRRGELDQRISSLVERAKKREEFFLLGKKRGSLGWPNEISLILSKLGSLSSLCWWFLYLYFMCKVCIPFFCEMLLQLVFFGLRAALEHAKPFGRTS